MASVDESLPETATSPSPRYSWRAVVVDAAGEGDVLGDPELAGAGRIVLDVGIAHDEEVGVAAGSEHLRHGFEQEIHALVGSQDAQEDHHLPPGWNPELAPERFAAEPRPKALGVDRVGQERDPAARAVIGERLGEAARARDDAIGHLGQPVLDWSEERASESLDESPAGVIGDLAGEAALEIGDQGRASRAADELPDEHPFVQMRMDDVRAEAGGGLEAGHDQEAVDVELVRRRAGREFLVPGDARSAHGAHALHVAAVVIGGDQHLVPAAGEDAPFFQDPDMTTAVGEERGGRDHQDAEPR